MSSLISSPRAIGLAICMMLFILDSADAETCIACNGVGEVNTSSRRVEKWDTSRVLAGDKSWMKGYTHYTWKTGEYTYEGGGYVTCRRCGGSGQTSSDKPSSGLTFEDFINRAFMVDGIKYVPVHRVDEKSDIVYREEGGKRYYGVSGLSRTLIKTPAVFTKIVPLAESPLFKGYRGNQFQILNPHGIPYPELYDKTGSGARYGFLLVQRNGMWGLVDSDGYENCRAYISKSAP